MSLAVSYAAKVPLPESESVFAPAERRVSLVRSGVDARASTSVE
jgi:hypothetical protein